jgi:glutamate mutase epsilon subunit
LSIRRDVENDPKDQYFIPYTGTISLESGIGPEQYKYVYNEIISLVEEGGLKIDLTTTSQGTSFNIHLNISGIQDL